MALKYFNTFSQHVSHYTAVKLVGQLIWEEECPYFSVTQIFLGTRQGFNRKTKTHYHSMCLIVWHCNQIGQFFIKNNQVG